MSAEAPRPRKKARPAVCTAGAMLTYNAEFLAGGATSDTVVAEFHAFVLEKRRSLDFHRFSATMELSLRTNRSVSLAEVFGADALQDEGVQRVR